MFALSFVIVVDSRFLVRVKLSISTAVKHCNGIVTFGLWTSKLAESLVGTARRYLLAPLSMTPSGNMCWSEACIDLHSFVSVSLHTTQEKRGPYCGRLSKHWVRKSERYTKREDLHFRDLCGFTPPPHRDYGGFICRPACHLKWQGCTVICLSSFSLLLVLPANHWY